MTWQESCQWLSFHFFLPCLIAQWAQTQRAAPRCKCCLMRCLTCKRLKTTPPRPPVPQLKVLKRNHGFKIQSNENNHLGKWKSLMRTITFLRWPSLNLKISSCSWYSACDNLQRDAEATSVQLKLWAWSEHLWGKPFSYVSLSVPFVLLLRLFCSRLGGGVWAMDGGLRLARSFLCLSMSSRWELIRSCCLETEEAHTWNPILLNC